jgi:hypothetical protein
MSGEASPFVILVFKRVSGVLQIAFSLSPPVEIPAGHATSVATSNAVVLTSDGLGPMRAEPRERGPAHPIFTVQKNRSV